MALINCSVCGKKISERAAACVHCGSPNKHVYKAQQHYIQQPSNPNIAMPKNRNDKGFLICPNCGESHIQIIQTDINMKQQSVLNINPLQPFTLMKHKKKKKLSGAKTAAAIFTLGLSAPLTGGIRKKEQLEVFCTDCGYRWVTK